MAIGLCGSKVDHEVDATCALFPETRRVDMGGIIDDCAAGLTI